MKKILVCLSVLFVATSVFSSEEKTTYHCVDMYSGEKVTLNETVIKDANATTVTYTINGIEAGCQSEYCTVIASYSNKKNTKVHAVEFENCKRVKTLI